MTEQQLTYLNMLGLVLWGYRPSHKALEEGLPEVPIPRSRKTTPSPAKPSQVSPIHKNISVEPSVSPIDNKPKPADKPVMDIAMPEPSEAVGDPKTSQAPAPAMEAALEASVKPAISDTPHASQPQDAFAFRYEAVIVPPVIILYEITGQLELPTAQRELLNSMLSRCGLKASQLIRSLPWPPPYSLGEGTEIEDAHQAYMGFLTALVDNHQCTCLVLMGESKLTAELSEAEIIHLDSLRLLVQEPKRRKYAWEKLAPLRALTNPNHDS